MSGPAEDFRVAAKRVMGDTTYRPTEFGPVHPRFRDELARMLHVAPENVVVTDDLPPGVTMIVGAWGTHARLWWEPASPPWPGPYRPVLAANVLAAAAADCDPLPAWTRWFRHFPEPVVLGEAWWEHLHVDPMVRAVADVYGVPVHVLVAPPRNRWSPHFTLLEDGVTILDHRPYLTTCRSRWFSPETGVWHHCTRPPGHSGRIHADATHQWPQGPARVALTIPRFHVTEV